MQKYSGRNGYYSEQLNQLKTFRTEIERYLKTVEMRLKRSIQSIETVRLTHSKAQVVVVVGIKSFSTSFLDERGDGVVVSGLYSRDRVSVFNKVVKAILLLLRTN